MRVKVFFMAGCLVALLASPMAMRADNCTGGGNLVANCSFGTNDFTGWDVTSNDGLDTQEPNYNGATFPDNSANFGATDNKYAIISQTLGTTSGTKYTLSFWLWNIIGDGPESDTDFQALWNSTPLLDQFTTTSGYVEYSYTVTGTGSDTLTFEGYNGPSAYELGDISVTSGTTSPIPEPSSLWLLGSGLAGLAGMLRRRFV
jgi:hypothetical protein